ncbi:MAG: DUF423 domain-containing protein [Brevundimonas sp.]
MTPNRPLALFAALNGAMAVALGAFAAHGAGPQVKSLLTTGAHYQGLHAMLALVCALALPSRLGRAAGWCAGVGGLVFALALSAIALADLRTMGAVAPIGGVLMIGSWLLLALAFARPARPPA